MLQAFRVEIQETTCPVSVRADMRSLADATALQVGALQALWTLKLLDEGSSVQEFTAAEAAVSAAVGAVRHDLGMPPPAPPTS